MKSTIKYLLAVSLLFLSLSSNAEIVCNNINAGLSECTVRVVKKELYIIEATAKAVNGHDKPYINLVITVNEKECARNETYWHNNEISLSASCQGNFTPGKTHKVKVTSGNKHADAAGVIVKIRKNKIDDTDF